MNRNIHNMFNDEGNFNTKPVEIHIILIDYDTYYTDYKLAV